MKPDKAWFCVIVGAIFMALAVVGFVTTDDLAATGGVGALRGPTWLAYVALFVAAGVGTGFGIRALVAWRQR